MDMLKLDKDIQVYTGKWMDVKVVSVAMTDVVDFEGNQIKGLSFVAKFEDGCMQTVTDAFGFGADQWRYKEKCCEQCKWHDIEGGDAVPYGSGTAMLPENIICNCPEMSEDDIEEFYEITNGGKECKFFKEEYQDEVEEVEDGDIEKIVIHYKNGEEETIKKGFFSCSKEELCLQRISFVTVQK